MQTTKQLAKHLEQVYFGGNWTASNFKDVLEGVTLDIATKKVNELNTILALSYHVHYYLNGTMDAIKTGNLTIRDKFSFNHPCINNEDEWQDFLSTLWIEAKAFISLIESLDDSILETFFAEEKYGTYYKNLTGIIEHTHYHLGQIAILKKMVISS